MLRIAVILSLAACDVGALPGFGPDGSTGGGDGSGSAVCETIAAAAPPGHHNPGMGCTTATQCHNEALGLGLNAPAYAFGVTFVLLKLIGKLPPMRASDEEEALALDVTYHGEEAYATGEGAILVSTEARIEEPVPVADPG